MSPVPTTARLPDSRRSLPVCPRGANSSMAAAPAQPSPAKPVPRSPESCTLSLSHCGHSWPGAQEPGQALCSVGHICGRDLDKKDLFQPLWSSRLRVCPASPSTSWNADPNPSLLYHCQTPPEPSFCLLPGLCASRAERRGEEEVEWGIF